MWTTTSLLTGLVLILNIGVGMAEGECNGVFSDIEICRTKFLGTVAVLPADEQVQFCKHTLELLCCFRRKIDACGDRYKSLILTSFNNGVQNTTKIRINNNCNLTHDGVLQGTEDRCPKPSTVPPSHATISGVSAGTTTAGISGGNITTATGSSVGTKSADGTQKRYVLVLICVMSKLWHPFL